MPAKGSCCSPCEPCEVLLDCSSCTAGESLQICGRPCQWIWSAKFPGPGYEWHHNQTYDDGDGVVRFIPCCEGSSCPEPSYSGTVPGEIAYTNCDPALTEYSSALATICLPRRLCVTVRVGSAACCFPDNTFHFQMLMTCSPTVWSGEGTCGHASLALNTTMVENGGVCTFRTVPNSDTAQAAETTSLTFSMTYTDGTYTYTIDVSEAPVLPHPYNGQACNPCICARCLPPSFCVFFNKTNAVANPAKCVPCFDYVRIPIDPCTGGGTASITCGDEVYTVTIALVPIYEQVCGIDFTFAGPDFYETARLLLEGRSGTSENGCWKCCQAGYATPISRIGACAGVNCTDCLTEDDTSGCGKVVLDDLDFSVTYDDMNGDHDDVSIHVSPMWCNEKCNADGQEPDCCYRVSRATTANCDGVPEVLANILGCDGWPTDIPVNIGGVSGFYCGVAPVYCSSKLGSTSFLNAWALADPVELELWCCIPTDCESVTEGEHPEKFELVFRQNGDCILNYCYIASPNSGASCRPVFLEFTVPAPPHLGPCIADPLCCPFYCVGSTLTIRLTE